MAQVTGEGSRPLLGHVISISEPQAVATVEFDISKDMCIPRANNTLEVPLSRLQPPSSEVGGLLALLGFMRLTTGVRLVSQVQFHKAH